jgi:uncharacterized membrane protein (UPF0127 family)
MRTVAAAKTKSAPKLSRSLLVIVGTLVLVGIVLIAGAHSETKLATKKLVVNGRIFTLEVAQTQAQQEQGLSGRTSLDPSRGMLFPAASSGNQCFWMKDMKFSLDIIWADSSKRVTQIDPGLSPSTYPKQYCATGQYIIELKAGQVRYSDMRVGQIIQF